MRLFLIIPLCLGFILSCSPHELKGEQDEDFEYSTVVMTMSEYHLVDSEVLTKNEAIYNNESWNLVWATNDTIGIFPDKGSQIYFSMAAGAGQSSASFDGGGWALKKGSTYFSYFPFTPDFYINKDAIPLTYVGQVQNGNSDPDRANFGKFGYMVANGVADEATGALHFNYHNLGILFRVRIPVSAGTYTSLTAYTTDNVLVQSGTVNAVDMSSLKIENQVLSNNLTLDFEELTFSDPGTLVAFMMMAPFDYLNKQMTLELTKADGTKEVSSVRGRTYNRGEAYLNASHLNLSPAYIDVPGSSNEFTFDILASGTHQYAITSDETWLTPSITEGSGTKTVSVTAEKNEGSKRTGYITVSETVNGVELKNVVTVTQYPEGFYAGIAAWEDSGINYGGVVR